MAWVEGGRLRVEHPEGGPYPVVVPCPEVELIVNGRRQEGPVEVRAGDEVELRARDEERPGSWRVEVTPDGMEAAVLVSPEVRVHRTLVDLPPSPRLRLRVTEEVSVRSPLGADEAREALAQLGVTFGVDERALDSLAEVTAECRVVVARGRPPVPGEDARVELFFPEEERVPVERGSEASDPRLRFTFTSVGPGEVLARRHPPRPGLPGTTVRGEEVPTNQPRDLVLVAGRGAELDPEGMEVRATARGRPVYARSGGRAMVQVVSQLSHPRDVDLSTGHIHFKGDVRVGGSVLEGMEVTALGTVEVGGSVTGGRVSGGAGVRVARGVVSATVVAGHGVGPAATLMPLAAAVARWAGELEDALRQLLGQCQAPPGTLLRALLETRFSALAGQVTALARMYAELPRREREGEVEEALQGWQRLLSAPLALKEVDDLAEVGGVLRRWAMELEATVRPDASLRCSYAMNSTLQAGGDILVTGNGCHNSRLLAGGSVHVEKVFRGGEIQAGTTVWVGELGAPGVPTRVRVPATGWVKSLRVAEDSVVQVGDRTYRFLAEERRVGVRLGPEGKLEFFW